ncbi:ATP-binding protein [Umezawaea sp. NPDC059074]|uniref:ATP-binding protein n=1 Tax=Umezawaea sp. NPDC059074 TaxID=3346716 RepID=UPI00369D1AA4
MRAETTNVVNGASGPSLQAGAVHGDVHLHSDHRPDLVAPHQLPAPTRAFAGRGHELAALTSAVDRDPDGSTTVAISAIGGMGGVGKTCLALHWAHRNRHRFPDGQLYVNLRGFDPGGKPMAAAVAVRGFLDALNVPPESIPADVDAQAALYRSAVSGRRMLIVLDNARDADQVVPLLPGSAACTVLVTSRRRLVSLATGQGAHLISLDVLAAEEAVDLLVGHVGRARVDADPEAVRDLIALSGGLPLALSIVGGRAAAHSTFPLGEFAAELRDARRRLDVLGNDDVRSDLRAVFEWSYLALRPVEARLFRLLGTVGSPDITRDAAAGLAGLDTDETARLLRGLVNANLVENHEPRRFRLHDLVRLYAAEKAGEVETDADLAGAQRRWVDFHLHSAAAASACLDPQRQRTALEPPDAGCTPVAFTARPEALAWLDSEHACLLAAGKVAVRHGWHARVWNLAFALDTFHWRRGHVHDHVATWRDALASASLLGDPGVEGRAHRYLGFACSRAGHHDEAVRHLTTALNLGKQVGDIREQARARQDLAHAWERQGLFRLALHQALLAWPLFQLAGAPVWEARALSLAGLYHFRLGEHGEARRLCERSLTLSKLHGDLDGDAATLHCLGDISHHSGERARAAELYEEALALRTRLGNDYGAAESAEGLGRSLVLLGRRDEAVEPLGHAARLYRSQNRVAEADVVEKLIRTLLDRPSTAR